MPFARYILSALLLIAAAPLAAVAAAPPDYAAVHAVFAKHCMGCHDAKEAEGEFVMERFDLLMKGGESGPAILAGKAADSPLVAMIEHRTKPFMPPPKKGAKLSDVEIALVRAWIDAGAKPGPTPLGASSPTTKPVELPKIAPKGPARQPANAIAAASKGNRYAVAGYGRIELRTADRRSIVRTIEGLRGNVNDLVFSADGALLAAASGSPSVAGEVRIFKTKGAVPVRTIAGHADAVYTLAISPDGATLATGSYDQKIKLWDLKTGNELRTLEGHNGGVFDLAFRPDGKTLASASADRTVKLWDVATGARLDTLSESTKELHAVAWTPDGSRVIAGGVDNRIRVWAVSPTAKEGTNKLATSQFAHEGSILRLAFSADGKTIISSADDKTVKLWNAADVSPVRALPPQPDWPTALAFAPGDKAAIVGRLDGSVEFYDLASGNVSPPPPPAKPELTAAEPRGVQRGVATRVKLSGKNLDDVTAVIPHHPKLKAELAADGRSAAGAAVMLTADAALAPGAYEVSLKGPGGESAKVAIHVDDLPQTTDAEPKDESAANLPALPANVWGTFDRRGDTDAFTFDAKAGQAIVLDGAAKRLGAKADVVLTVTDATGRVLAHVNDTDGDLDPLVVFTPGADGRYGVRVSELQANASADHFYRLSIGSFGVVTGTSPLAVPPSAETAVNLLGYNLPAGATARVKAGAGGEADVPLDAAKFRPRAALKVPVSPLPATVEAEPNDRPAAATPLAVPGAGEGASRPAAPAARTPTCSASRPRPGRTSSSRRSPTAAARRSTRGSRSCTPPTAGRSSAYCCGRCATRGSRSARSTRTCARTTLALGGDGAQRVRLLPGRGGEAVPLPARARLGVRLLRDQRQAAVLLRHDRHRPRGSTRRATSSSRTRRGRHCRRTGCRRSRCTTRTTTTPTGGSARRLSA